MLKLAATGTEMHHTDRNTLDRVKLYHPSVDACLIVLPPGAGVTRHRR
ncbi:MAG: hypothetical protein ACRDWT_06655 [Jatrophihabitantaceae bacterium]